MSSFAFLGSPRWVSTGPLPLENMNESILICCGRGTKPKRNSREAADNKGSVGSVLEEAHERAERTQGQSEGLGPEDTEEEEMRKG